MSWARDRHKTSDRHTSQPSIVLYYLIILCYAHTPLLVIQTTLENFFNFLTQFNFLIYNLLKIDCWTDFHFFENMKIGLNIPIFNFCEKLKIELLNSIF